VAGEGDARVYYDQVHHRIYYHDATISLFGVPVMYTPYFAQSDPTVKHSRPAS
jgi:LPS-assembly protein